MKRDGRTVNIGGVVVQLQAYALVEGTGSTNYVKVRDVAAALDGTAAQFNVGWRGDQGIFLEPGVPYDPSNRPPILIKPRRDRDDPGGAFLCGPPRGGGGGLGNGPMWASAPTHKSTIFA